MKIRIIAVGKNKQDYISQAVEDFSSRLKRYCELEMIIVKESAQYDDLKKALKEEGGEIIKKIDNKYLTVALDSTGKEFDSIQFSSWMNKTKESSGSRIQLIIGGSHGLSAEVLVLAQTKISFSRMTFTHQMVRIILLEQLYRAFEILRGGEYHK